MSKCVVILLLDVLNRFERISESICSFDFFFVNNLFVHWIPRAKDPTQIATQNEFSVIISLSIYSACYCGGLGDTT